MQIWNAQPSGVKGNLQQPWLGVGQVLSSVAAEPRFMNKASYFLP